MIGWDYDSLVRRILVVKDFSNKKDFGQKDFSSKKDFSGHSIVFRSRYRDWGVSDIREDRKF